MKAILKHISLKLIMNSYPLFHMQQAMLMGQLNQAGMLGSQQQMNVNAQQQMHNAMMNQQMGAQLQNYKPPTLKFGNVFGSLSGMGLQMQGLSAIVRKPLWALSITIKDTTYSLSLIDA